MIVDRIDSQSITPNFLAFPGIAIEALDCVTKRPSEPYEAFIERILPNPLASRVKIADLLDNMNLVRLGREITEKDVARLRKYQRALARLTKKTATNSSRSAPVANHEAF